MEYHLVLVEVQKLVLEPLLLLSVLGCSVLKLMLEQNTLVLTDDDTIKELRTFSKRMTLMQQNPKT